MMVESSRAHPAQSGAGAASFTSSGSTSPSETKGLGRALMAEVEREAKRRGCRLVMGLTYDVVAADYYDRLGYRTVGFIEDCPAGTTTRWYCKELEDCHHEDDASIRR